MKMTLRPEAVNFLQDKIPDGSFVLLALNDGSNKYSKMGGTCDIGANFQLVIMREKDPAFDIPVENNDNLNLWTSEAEKVFLKDSLTLDQKFGMLSLADDSGIIDSAMTVNTDWDKPLSKDEMQEIGKYQC